MTCSDSAKGLLGLRLETVKGVESSGVAEQRTGLGKAGGGHAVLNLDQLERRGLLSLGGVK